MQGLVQRRGAAGADWSRLAVAAGATLSAISALVIATHIAVVLAADGLAGWLATGVRRGFGLAGWLVWLVVTGLRLIRGQG